MIKPQAIEQLIGIVDGKILTNFVQDAQGIAAEGKGIDFFKVSGNDMLHCGERTFWQLSIICAEAAGAICAGGGACADGEPDGIGFKADAADSAGI